MDKNKLDRLKEILSIPSLYGREEKVRNYISQWAIARNIPFYIDVTGNIYLTKGQSDSYPCIYLVLSFFESPTGYKIQKVSLYS